MRRVRACVLLALFACCGALLGGRAFGAPEPLPSWNDGAAKRALIAFVRATTERASPQFVAVAERVATFDQDGTLWVEQPMYAQLMFCIDRVPALVEAKPELANEEPFKTVLSGDREAIAKLPKHELEKLLAATLSGMTTDAFDADVKKWLAKAKHPRWHRPYTELAYAPMLELLGYLRAHGYRTFIVTGGGQDFVRSYAQAVYGIATDRVVGTIGETRYTRDDTGKGVLIKQPKLVVDDDKTGKPEAIHMMIGQRPRAAFGNSSGDQSMLEYAKTSDGARLVMLVLHDDAEREFAYGPAQGLPDSKVGTFPQSLYDAAQAQGWITISMKKDWNRVFAFERKPRH